MYETKMNYAVLPFTLLEQIGKTSGSFPSAVCWQLCLKMVYKSLFQVYINPDPLSPFNKFSKNTANGVPLQISFFSHSFYTQHIMSAIFNQTLSYILLSYKSYI